MNLGAIPTALISGESMAPKFRMLKGSWNS